MNNYLEEIYNKDVVKPFEESIKRQVNEEESDNDIITPIDKDGVNKFLRKLENTYHYFTSGRADRKINDSIDDLLDDENLTYKELKNKLNEMVSLIEKKRSILKIQKIDDITEKNTINLIKNYFQKVLN